MVSSHTKVVYLVCAAIDVLGWTFFGPCESLAVANDLDAANLQCGLEPRNITQYNMNVEGGGGGKLNIMSATGVSVYSADGIINYTKT